MRNQTLEMAKLMGYNLYRINLGLYNTICIILNDKLGDSNSKKYKIRSMEEIITK
jgi:hypothetical protein